LGEGKLLRGGLVQVFPEREIDSPGPLYEEIEFQEKQGGEWGRRRKAVPCTVLGNLHLGISPAVVWRNSS